MRALTGSAVLVDDTAPLLDVVDGPSNDVASLAGNETDPAGGADLLEPVTSDNEDALDDEYDTGDEDEESSFTERSTEEIPATGLKFSGEAWFHWVYRMSVSIGVLGQVLGFGELFGGHAHSYAAAFVVGSGFELIMVTFGDLALGMRTREHKARQWLPFMLISAVAATVASGMNLLHWWSFDRFHTLAMIFAGVAMLGYLGHMFSGFVKGTQYLAELDRRRRIRARELVAERRRAEAERKAAAEAERKRQYAEQLREKADAARKNLPRAPRKGTKIGKDRAVTIGIALGVTTKDGLIQEITSLGWEAPSSKNTLKSWMGEIATALDPDS